MNHLKRRRVKTKSANSTLICNFTRKKKSYLKITGNLISPLPGTPVNRNTLYLGLFDNFLQRFIAKTTKQV